jgi:hypothetical protein
MKRKSLLVLTVSAALAVAAFAATSNSQKSTVTVGDFAVRVTKAMGAPVASPTAAVKSLRAIGVKTGIDDPNAGLTEGTAARILADLGLRVTTTNPQGSVTSGKADQLAAVVGLASSKPTLSPSATSPTQCLDVKNRGTCQDCCKAYFGCTDPNAQCDFSSGCARFCKQVPPPGQASPSDPNP